MNQGGFHVFRQTTLNKNRYIYFQSNRTNNEVIQTVHLNRPDPSICGLHHQSLDR